MSSSSSSSSSSSQIEEDEKMNEKLIELPKELSGTFLADESKNSNLLAQLTSAATPAASETSRRQGNEIAPTDRRKLFVRNVPRDATDAELESFFGEFGPTRFVARVIDRSTNRFNGVVFVTYALADDALRALQQAPRAKFRGHRCPMKLELALRRLRDEDKLPDEEREQRQAQRKAAVDAKVKEQKLRGSAIERIVEIRGLHEERLGDFEQLCVAEFGPVEDAHFKSGADAHIVVRFADVAHAAKCHKQLSHDKVIFGQQVQSTRGRSKAQLEKSQIIVRNLPFETQVSDVRPLFDKIGTVREFRMPLSADGKARGFAFVQFLNPMMAQKAINTLNKTPIKGRKIIVDWAASKDAYDQRMTEQLGGKKRKDVAEKDDEDDEDEDEDDDGEQDDGEQDDDNDDEEEDEEDQDDDDQDDDQDDDDQDDDDDDAR
jgi:nucleolar protein 4